MSNKSVIAIAIVCVILFSLIVGGAIMMAGGKSANSANYNVKFANGDTLTWDELLNEENAEKYGYNVKVLSKDAIGPDAFRGTELVYIKIPETVINISNTAFAYAPKLERIDVVSANAVYASTADGCLYFKKTTTLQTVPAALTGDFVIASGTTEIGDFAFANCISITNITIPETVIKIGSHAFDGINVRTLIIPNTVKRIGLDAFINIERMDIHYLGTKMDWYKGIGSINIGELPEGVHVFTAD